MKYFNLILAIISFLIFLGFYLLSEELKDMIFFGICSIVNFQLHMENSKPK